jgi:predicted TIM-barrel fold metal-dependent hydrolase
MIAVARVLWNVTLLWGLAALCAAEELPLFDGHIHYSGDAWSSYPPEKVLQLLDEAKIEKALLSSTPIEGTLKLYQADPKRFIPELRVYRKATSLETWYAERATWWRDPELIPFLEEELKRGIYKGIGEFHLFGVEARSVVIKRMVKLAVERKLLLHAHSDAAAIETLFEHDPEARILWAHAGMNTPPQTVGDWLDRFPNLWVELSYRQDVVAGDALDPRWRELFLRYPDRFVTGSDTWTPSRWPEVPALAKWTRNWLSQLPPEVARKIAYDNGKRLLGF